MYRNYHGLIISPSDLTNYLDSPFASWMDRWEAERKYLEKQGGDINLPEVARLDACRCDEPDEQMQLIMAKGIEHEERFLDHLRAEGREVVTIEQSSDAEQQTLDAMKRGAELIFQARLRHDRLVGWADFLVRVDVATG